MRAAVRAQAAIAADRALLEEERDGLNRRISEITSVPITARNSTVDAELPSLRTKRGAVEARIAELGREQAFARVRDQITTHARVAHVEWVQPWVADGTRLERADPVLELQLTDGGLHRIAVRETVRPRVFAETLLTFLEDA